MCANYIPVTSQDRLLSFFGVDKPVGRDAPAVDVYPLGTAPFIRLAEAGSGHRVLEAGMFGLLPGFAKELAFGRKTYNARSETVDRLASFRTAWARGQRCIVPVEAIFEYCHETGSAQRWCIAQPLSRPFGIGGLYSVWTAPDGTRTFSFTMVTVNADGHPVFGRMHPPGDEKRMPLILDPADHDRWLGGSPEEARSLFRPFMGPLECWPMAAPGRTPRAAAPRAPRRAAPAPRPAPPPDSPAAGPQDDPQAPLF
ncbi:SOS response-associated peptidase [Ideonella sp.]|uniref:SOS response-associated peptidase n=1 Tax=Ideonella sp. TaxID=1929293 RepID=UPI0035AE1E19